mmetsp:Transcript_1092/g.1651  ORF Transcript_1092/g.1651 Transcript_1092/m.1651 type:complete len:364 (-) Transcript_1092:24-1115(-)
MEPLPNIPAAALILNSFAVVIWLLISTPVMFTLQKLRIFDEPSLPEVDLSQKVCIVTGSNTGIGKRTALHLAKRKATVILACRTQHKAESARCEIIEEIKSMNKGFSPNIDIIEVDLSDTKSVRKFVNEFVAKYSRLDILINNAGLNSRGVTRQNLDLTMSSNFLGHFLMTNLLQKMLVNTPNSRVINLSSVMHHYGTISWADFSNKNRFIQNEPYMDSKLAMVLFSKELRKKYNDMENCTTSCFVVNPGGVLSDIWRFIPTFLKPLTDICMKILLLDTEKGCFTSVHAATSPLYELGGRNGHIYRQPYFLPLSFPHPFEMLGPFVGSKEGKFSIPLSCKDPGQKIWESANLMIEIAEKKLEK